MNKHIAQTNFPTIILGVVILSLIFSVSMIHYRIFKNIETRIYHTKEEVIQSYQKTIDLVPDLLQIFKSMALKEQDVFLEVIKTRAQATQYLENVKGKRDFDVKDQLDIKFSQWQMMEAIKQLFIISEKYPALKHNKEFVSLMKELLLLENLLDFYHKRYNASVKYYRRIYKKFPGKYLAPIFGFKEKNYFVFEKHLADFNISPKQSAAMD